MALTYLERYGLAHATPFLRRVEIAAIKYAVYLINSGATGDRGTWARSLINGTTYRAQEVQWLRWYVVENVAAGLALVENASDSAATDAAIQGELEVKVNATYPAA